MSAREKEVGEMSLEFSKGAYYGYIVKGDLIGAIRYVKQFPEQIALYRRYMAVFEQEQYITYEVDAYLNGILTAYQRYYRDVFYLRIGKKRAVDNLRARLCDFLGRGDDSAEVCDMEQKQIAGIFESRGFHFLGGRTSGYYGPYAWRTTETQTYEVELPDGIQQYTVKLLDDFLTRSWIDFLSFGEIGPGGWSNGGGMINCVKSAYDFESESFRVSLLKHEAQHARDLMLCKDMSSEDLEYRAKLVELIYSSERNLLQQFLQEADGGDKSNGHSAASNRIAEKFTCILGKNDSELGLLPVEQIQAAARMLFEESNKKLIT